MFKKYIIVDGEPILFSNNVLHAGVVPTMKIDSAGFFLITDEDESGVFCCGESNSLGIASRPEIDQKIISIFLNLKNK